VITADFTQIVVIYKLSSLSFGSIRDATNHLASHYAAKGIIIYLSLHRAFRPKSVLAW